MNKQQKHVIAFATAFALMFGIVPNVAAMHIMEGYLPAGYCVAWGVLCLPFLAAGFFSIKKTLNEHRNLITLLAMSDSKATHLLVHIFRVLRYIEPNSLLF